MQLPVPYREDIARAEDGKPFTTNGQHWRAVADADLTIVSPAIATLQNVFHGQVQLQSPSIRDTSLGSAVDKTMKHEGNKPVRTLNALERIQSRLHDPQQRSLMSPTHSLLAGAFGFKVINLDTHPQGFPLPTRVAANHQEASAHSARW